MKRQKTADVEMSKNLAQLSFRHDSKRARLYSATRLVDDVCYTNISLQYYRDFDQQLQPAVGPTGSRSVLKTL